MTRQDIKKAIKDALEGTPGVKAIFTARQRMTQNALTPVITIYLPDLKDHLVTAPAPLGKRRLEFTALLEIIMLDVNPVVEVGEAQFDDILDAVDKKLRASFNLGGVVDGSAIKNLETHLGAPQLVEGNTVFRAAIKRFDVTLTINGI